MSVELDPPELGFRRPFTHEVTQILRLRNPNNDPVAFKVKTTAPKQYCVRPNSGRIEPGREVEIQVLLQAMKEDPPLDARCRDKFLVQSVAISADQDIGNVASIWQNIEQTAKSSIQERKIRVIFLPNHTEQPSSTPQHNDINGMHVPEGAPPAYSSPSPTFGSPAVETATPRDRHVEKTSITPITDSQDMEKSSALSAPSAALNSVSSSISNAASATSQTLQQQLEAAKATIAQLQGQTEEQGLRQRKTDAVAQDSRERLTTGTTGIGVQTQAADGVPVQIVAGLCLLSFLLAYFFF